MDTHRPHITSYGPRSVLSPAPRSPTLPPSAADLSSCRRNLWRSSARQLGAGDDGASPHRTPGACALYACSYTIHVCLHGVKDATTERGRGGVGVLSQTQIVLIGHPRAISYSRIVTPHPPPSSKVLRRNPHPGYPRHGKPSKERIRRLAALRHKAGWGPLSLFVGALSRRANTCIHAHATVADRGGLG